MCFHEIGLPRWHGGKNPPADAGNARDTGSIPGLGRAPGAGNGHPVPVFLPGNPMDRVPGGLKYLSI